MLPAQRFDVTGRPKVALRIVFALAIPLIANSALQILLNLTDAWFVGRLSTQAMAAVGAVHWLIAVVVLLLGGVALAVQVVVAQFVGARRYMRAAQAAWTGIWGSWIVAPLFFAVALRGRWLLHLFGLDPQLQDLGAQFWLPRVAGAPLGLGATALLGFFNGTNRPQLTLLIVVAMTVSNMVLNQVFIFNYHLGIAGAAWATNVAQALGLAFAFIVFLNKHHRMQYRSHLTWKINLGQGRRLLWLGFSMSLLNAADFFAAALFQLMQAKIGSTAGAVTQLTMTLTSIAYLPGSGIAAAGMTLVGQSIGAGDRQWAMRVGSRVIALAAWYMGGIGVMLAIAAPWLIPKFTAVNDPQASLVVTSGVKILWLAAIYQFFDGLYIGSSLCLRAAGDTTVPAVLVFVLAWLVFIPLAHTFMFSRGEGWFASLPQLGWGLVGGWSAMVTYVTLLGTTLFMRWRSGAWKEITL